MIAYALTPNMPELLPYCALILFQIPVPMTTVMMLLICVGTDMVPDIALAYENAELDIMDRKPRNAKLDHLVTIKLISFAYIQMGTIQTVAAFYTYFIVMNDYGFKPRMLW